MAMPKLDALAAAALLAAVACGPEATDGAQPAETWRTPTRRLFLELDTTPEPADD